jgi:hypothetical protein
MTWEYYTYTVDVSGWFVSGDVNAGKLTESLNSIGAEGWELVSALSTVNGGDSNNLVFVFKRPVAEN